MELTPPLPLSQDLREQGKNAMVAAGKYTGIGAQCCNMEPSFPMPYRVRYSRFSFSCREELVMCNIMALCIRTHA